MGLALRIHGLLLFALAVTATSSSDAVYLELTREVDCTGGWRELGLQNQTIRGLLCYEAAVAGDGDGETVLASRWHVPQYKRLDHLDSFFDSIRIEVRADGYGGFMSRGAVPKFCIHKNASAPLGSCPGSRWRTIGKKDAWVTNWSPFEKALLEIVWQGTDLPPDVHVAISKDTDKHRVLCLAAGLLLMPLASSLSRIAFLYYSVGMSVGVLIIVFWGVYLVLKLLNLTRGSSIRAVFAGAVIGMGSLFITYLTDWATDLTDRLGLGDQFVNPLAYLSLGILVFIGAFMGFWFVRKLVVLPSGELDPTTIVFVRWSLRAFAGFLLILSSPDHLFGLAALSLGVLVTLGTSQAHRLAPPRRLFSAFSKRASSGRSGDDELEESDVPGTPVREASRAHTQDHSHARHRSPFQDQFGSPGGPGHLDAVPVLQQTFVSSYHRIDGRHGMTPEQVQAVSRECTAAAMKDLLSSPGGAKWVTQNLHRLQVIPDIKREQRPVSEIMATAFMEESEYHED